MTLTLALYCSTSEVFEPSVTKTPKTNFVLIPGSIGPICYDYLFSWRKDQPNHRLLSRRGGRPDDLGVIL